jgi:hypothetical protein
MSATLRQQIITSMFLKDVQDAMAERNLFAPANDMATGDPDFDEFFGVIDSNLLIYFTIPWGMTRDQYISEVRSALTAIIEGTPVDTPSMREAIQLIGAKP